MLLLRDHLTPEILRSYCEIETRADERRPTVGKALDVAGTLERASVGAARHRRQVVAGLGAGFDGWLVPSCLGPSSTAAAAIRPGKWADTTRCPKRMPRLKSNLPATERR
jgi:hypothetical protein